ncbi:unnamed protein product [Phytophthora fragariaefolia]|uniref:Unnamed protein product n=1 Tax=Phytophthora fragariaefolia TaxID=1490495 RepID=A0A9W6XCG4_9STRA|nr:unnamed protein product [Phytophthora fragariaefolia]
MKSCLETEASLLEPVRGGCNDRDENEDVVDAEEGSQPSGQPPPIGSAPTSATGAGNSSASDPAESRSSDTAGNNVVAGVILTSIRPVDAKLAAVYHLPDAEVSNDDDDANHSVESSVQETTGNKEAERGSTTQTLSVSRTPMTPAPVVRQQGLRGSGRPRATRRDPLPTVASPDGPPSGEIRDGQRKTQEKSTKIRPSSTRAPRC